MRVVKVLRLVVALFYVFVLVVPRGAYAADDKKPQWDITLKYRVPMALIVLTPTGKIGEYSSNGIVGAAAPVLEENTNLQLEDVGRTGKDVNPCKGRLVCFVETVRSDYDPARSDLHADDNPKQLKPWSEVRRVLNNAKETPPRFLAVLSSTRQADGRDRLSGVLIDTDAALDFIHRANDRKERTDPKKEEELEDRIAQYAVRASPAPSNVSKIEEIDRALYKMFTEDFRPAFEEGKNWAPYGSIEIESDQPNMAILFDGGNDPIGLTRAGKTTIGRVPPGDHTLRLTKPEFLLMEQGVSVERGQVAKVTMNPVREAKTGVRATRQVVFWTGIATGVAGAAVLALSIQRASDSRYSVICLSSAANDDCDGTGEFLEAGGPPMPGWGDSITTGKASGLPLAPLGYSLMAGGAAWALTTAFLNDDDTMPWIEIAAGAVVFLASFFTSYYVDGQNAVSKQK